ncbi:type II toxin-antitoxin system YafQ family toxin [Mycetohabitans sp. B46]|uniref:type II toxin-antitoxin system YafQ family toxin n=1 Tax=Mycetohabitans sp. B46 TaxID=2772536 RepID=UPI00307CEFA1
MRTIDRSSAFKRDYKREAKGQHRTTLDDVLKPVLLALATDQSLATRYRDHDLSGDWAGYRECHIKPDLLLIYRKSDSDTLRLARLGSHSQLFG